jgi:NAD(P)-dependent dehydrogenase (short-subunit alcohol dehydrogenase family)
MGRLSGKVAMVFGAGPNIGGTIAHFLAREGAKVVVTDVSKPAADEAAAFIKGKGLDATGVQADAQNEQHVRDAVRRTVEHYGALDVVINMAGKIYWSPVLNIELDQWKEAVVSFPTAAMLTTKHSAKAMIDGKRRGSIIHLLSTAAHFGEASGAAYTAAKAATLNFARSAAMDLAHEQIRVNTITPCAMQHQLWTMMKDEINNPGFKRPDRRSFYSRDDYLKNIPLERFPSSADLAWAAVFLASDEASFITGIDLPVDGGLRYKYPTWRPGDWTGVNIDDYAANVRITRYGEEHEPLVPKEKK